MGFTANQKELSIEIGILMSLTIFAIGLRFYVRHNLRSKRGPDDWFILAAGIVFCSQCIAMISNIHKGLTGVDPRKLPLPRLEEAMKGIYLMPVTLTLARLSVLFLYNRLFGVYRSFRLVLIGTGVASLCWLVTVALLNTFRCSPIKGVWKLTIPSRCLNLQTIFLVTETINAILDIALVCMPITKLKHLNLPLRERIGLVIVFLTGGFVGLTSVLRISFTYNPTKKGAILDSIFWLLLQLATAIICACLPTLRSLLPTRATFVPLTSALQKLLGSRSQMTSAKYSPESGSKATSQERLRVEGLYANSGKKDDGFALTAVTVECRSEREGMA